MFLGHLQGLFGMRPPNFQLLFSEPGNRPLQWDFDKPLAPRGCMVLKGCLQAKVNVLGHLKSLLSNTPKFPAFT